MIIVCEKYKIKWEKMGMMPNYESHLARWTVFLYSFFTCGGDNDTMK